MTMRRLYSNYSLPSFRFTFRSIPGSIALVCLFRSSLALYAHCALNKIKLKRKKMANAKMMKRKLSFPICNVYPPLAIPQTLQSSSIVSLLNPPTLFSLPIRKHIIPGPPYHRSVYLSSLQGRSGIHRNANYQNKRLNNSKHRNTNIHNLQIPSSVHRPYSPPSTPHLPHSKKKKLPSADTHLQKCTYTTIPPLSNSQYRTSFTESLPNPLPPTDLKIRLPMHWHT